MVIFSFNWGNTDENNQELELGIHGATYAAVYLNASMHLQKAR